MGAFISHSTGIMDKDLQYDLFHMKISTVMEIADIINQTCCGETSLNKEDFEDVIGIGLGCSEKLFDLLKEPNSEIGEDTVSIYEAMSALTILCQDSYEKKINYQFAVFDFDRNFKQNQVEFVTTIITTINAQAKVCQCEIPSHVDLDIFASKQFQQTDKDFSDTIEVEELHTFIKLDADIQDFLQINTGSQSYENAERRHKEYFDRCMDNYKMLVYNKDVNPSLQEEFKKALQTILQIERKNVDYIQDLCLRNRHSSDEFATYDFSTFKEIINASACYKAIDISANGNVNKYNYYLMIWLFYDEKPDDNHTTQVGIDNIDVDRDGSIEFIEWISYLCLKDKDGSTFFDGHMRRLWMKFDVDGSDSLGVPELQKLIYEVFKRYVSNKLDDQLQRETAMKDTNDMIEAMVANVLRELGLKKDGVVKWNQFMHFFQEGCKEIAELETLIQFIKTNTPCSGVTETMESPHNTVQKYEKPPSKFMMIKKSAQKINKEEFDHPESP